MILVIVDIILFLKLNFWNRCDVEY